MSKLPRAAQPRKHTRTITHRQSTLPGPAGG
jgi:hypothetical protein